MEAGGTRSATPFTYDVRKNLSVLFATDLGPAGKDISVWTDTMFVLCSVGRNDNNVDASWLPTFYYNGIMELAIDIAK